MESHDEFFAEDVTVETFLEEHLPVLHRERLERFGHMTRVPIILSFLLEDTGDRFTVRLDSQGVEVERGEMIDFPLATIVTQRSYWQEGKDHFRRLLALMDAYPALAGGRYRELALTKAVVEEFERFEGLIEVQLRGMKDKEMRFGVVLNDYETDPAAPRFVVSVSIERVYQLARNEITPSDVARDLQIEGQMKLPPGAGRFCHAALRSPWTLKAPKGWPLEATERVPVSAGPVAGVGRREALAAREGEQGGRAIAL